MSSGFLIASGISFVLTLISFLIGSYYVDKYVQLLSLTNQHNAYTRSAMRIGLYLFFLPALFSFFGMKFLQIHTAIVGGNTQAVGLTAEIQSQAGGITLFLVTYGILLIGYGQLLIRMNLKRKLLYHVPSMLLFSVVLTVIAHSIVVSLLISCIMALGILIYTYRKSASATAQTNNATIISARQTKMRYDNFR